MSKLKELISERSNFDYLVSEVFIFDPELNFIEEGIDERKEIELNNSLIDKFPQELLVFKNLFHPIKFGIINILNKYYQLPAKEIKDILGIPYNLLDYHAKALMKDGIIDSAKVFIDEIPTITFVLNTYGQSQFQKLSEILSELIRSVSKKYSPLVSIFY